MASDTKTSEVLSAKATKDHVDVVDEIELKPTYGDKKLDKFGAAVELDPAEVALVRKLDLFMMPVLWLMYFLNFLDRNAMINGKLNKLDKDLGMKGTQYNTCVSIFFVGYLLGQVPSNMLLNRVKPAWYMSGCMLAWALVSTFPIFAKNYHGMFACRFVLGIVEAPFYPGAIYMISQFYTRKETATRMAVFYTGNLLASSFSGLIAAGVFAGLDGAHGMKGWKWLFLIQGVVTVAVAIVAFFTLPNAPLDTPWLTPAERQLAHNRIAMDTTERRESTNVWKGLREACCDYRVWLFALMGNMHISSNGFKNFMPTVVKTLGFNTTVTLVLTCPPYLLAAFTSVAVSWSSGYFNERTWHITVSKAVAIIGFVIGTATLNTGARYFAMCLFVGAVYGVNNINLAWTAATVAQTNEKKTVAIAIVNTLGNLSFVYTPYLWPDSDAPRFPIAMWSSVGFCAATIVVAWVLKFVLWRDNKKIKRANPEAVNFYVY